MFTNNSELRDPVKKHSRRDSPAAQSEESNKTGEKRLIPYRVNAQELCIHFARCVTVPALEIDWVARNGMDSIFTLFQQLFPQVGPVQKLRSGTFHLAHSRLMNLIAYFVTILQVTKPDHRRSRLKCKISRAEFNKTLQSSCDFTCARMRQRLYSR